MNYEKKRQRNKGRQARQQQETYQVWIDDQCKVHSKLIKPRKKIKKPIETPSCSDYSYLS